MSKLFDKFLAKILAIIVIILFVVAFREMILTDDDISTAFGSLMGMLPFAEDITDAVCKIMKCQYEIPVVTASSAMTDLIRLAFMACLQPIVGGLLTAIFLPLPKGMDAYEQEEYMDSFGYKVKELILTVISAPLLALAASWLSSWVFEFFLNQFGAIVSTLLGLLVVAGLGAVSLVPLFVTGTAVATAVSWRLLVTFGSKMITTFVTNIFCLAVYVAFVGGIEKQITTSVLALIVWLIVMNFGLKCLQYSVVRKSM
ncbi:MAG: hypothetical protein MR308_11180 [Lachnospiraceae bacterium]|nr:hypothetical protein [Lachnospiraceae bacterium]